MNEDWAVPEGDSGVLLGSDLPSHGRPAEVDQLIRQHNDALVKYAYRLTHSWIDARDVVQEAHCRFLRLDDPTARSYFRGYLYRTVRNVAIEWMRKRQVSDSFLKEERLRTATEDFPSLERVWVARQDIEALVRAVEALPPRTQEALRMFKEEGLSYEQVAERLNIKVDSARRLINRAMNFLVGAITQENSFSGERR